MRKGALNGGRILVVVVKFEFIMKRVLLYAYYLCVPCGSMCV